MRGFWRPLALAAAFIATVLAGSATAQTVTVTKAPAGASVQVGTRLDDGRDGDRGQRRDRQARRRPEGAWRQDRDRRPHLRRFLRAGPPGHAGRNRLPAEPGRAQLHQARDLRHLLPPPDHHARRENLRRLARRVDQPGTGSNQLARRRGGRRIGRANGQRTAGAERFPRLCRRRLWPLQQRRGRVLRPQYRPATARGPAWPGRWA